MSYRIGSRPIRNDKSVIRGRGTGIAKKVRRNVLGALPIEAAEDILDKNPRQSKRQATQNLPDIKPVGKGSRNTKAAAWQAEILANVGYRGAFVMMDLTRSPAHGRRQAAMREILMAHDSLEAAKPGSGFLYGGSRVHADESHISVVRGVRAPLLHPTQLEALGEEPPAGHRQAFAAVARRKAALLELDDAVVYWPGPATGPAQYLVAAVKIKDPAYALSGMQRAWARAGGTSIEADMPMHLTLAYLKLGQKGLSDDVSRRVLMSLQGKDGKATQWLQDEVYYSGRYGQEFARSILKR